MKVVVMLPTYNEAGNIERLIDELQRVFSSIKHDMHVLVVDDDSPDGTADIVRRVQERCQNVHLITGSKVGLGTAIVRGMQHSMTALNADAVLEMDADFSHKPQDIPWLLANLDHGADFVIGSRYVPGGTVPVTWNRWRRVASLGGNIVARYLAGLYRVRDCTAGFRAMRTSVLQKIDLAGINVQGYAFLVALLHHAVTAGAKVVEVPVDFMDRAAGHSKLGIRDIVEFARNAWWIRFQKSETFLKFALVGISGVAVNLLALEILLRCAVNPFVASPVAIETSIVSNFLLNNFWTFRSRGSGHQLHVKGARFNLVSLASLGVSYSVFVILTLSHPDSPPQLNQLAGIPPAMFVNYFLNSWWTFAARRTTR